MPKLDKTLVTSLIRTDRRYRGNVRTLAEATGIPYGTLRNAIGSGDDMRYERITLVADALGVDESRIIEMTGPPTPPPQQPKGPKSPPPRRKREKKGPKRPSADMRAAS
jgi:hypothetical protein